MEGVLVLVDEAMDRVSHVAREVLDEERVPLTEQLPVYHDGGSCLN